MLFWSYSLEVTVLHNTDMNLLKYILSFVVIFTMRFRYEKNVMYSTTRLLLLKTNGCYLFKTCSAFYCVSSFPNASNNPINVKIYCALFTGFVLENDKFWEHFSQTLNWWIDSFRRTIYRLNVKPPQSLILATIKLRIWIFFFNYRVSDKWYHSFSVESLASTSIIIMNQQDQHKNSVEFIYFYWENIERLNKERTFIW